jgi:soluble lytic murein transglycosylase
MSTHHVSEILSDNLDLFPKSQSSRLAQHLITLCERYRFDPAFILSLIQVESSFKVKARSPVGALGLMQVMPGTAQFVAQELGLPSRFVADERAILEPFMNLTLGVAYLAWLRDHYRGASPYYLVAAYNIGPGRLDELLTRKSFRPRETKKYFEKIRAGVPGFRFYRKALPSRGRLRV